MQKAKNELINKIICIAILIIVLFEFLIPCLSYADTMTLTDFIVSKYPAYKGKIEQFWNDAGYDLDGWTGSRDEAKISFIDNEIIAPIKSLALNGYTSKSEQTSIEEQIFEMITSSSGGFLGIGSKLNSDKITVEVNNGKIQSVNLSDIDLDSYGIITTEEDDNNTPNFDDQSVEGLSGIYHSPTAGYYCTAKVAIDTWGDDVKQAIIDKIVNGDIRGNYDFDKIIATYQNDINKIRVGFNKLNSDGNAPDSSSGYTYINTSITLKDVENFKLSDTSDGPANSLETPGNAIETVDVFTGMILEPLLEFIRFVTDSIMGIITQFMTGSESFESVMQDEIVSNDTENVGATVTIDMEDYKNVFNNYIDYKFPNFKYSPEEIFTGKIDLLSIDFISGKIVDENGTRENGSSDWNEIRTTIASWYKALRLFAMVGLLSVLIYVGIKILISANSQDKAKYKERLVSWFIAMALLFSMHYIMAFIIAVVQNITTLLGDTMGVIQVNLDGTNETFTTNLLGLARFQAQQMAFSRQVEYIVIYVALVAFTIKFTFTYLRRVLNMAFLTLIAPIVALMYPLDKMNGEARSFQLWLKDYVYNALLQPMHYLLYMILINSALSLAANNPIYAIAALLFMTQAEKLLKRIFGFQRAKFGTVGGIAGAYATGSVVGSILGIFRKPPILSGGGSDSKSTGGTSQGSSDWIDDYYGPTLNDTDIENFYDSFGNAHQSLFPSGNGGGYNNSQGGSGPSANLLGVQNFIFNFRNSISGETLKNFRNKKDIDFNSFFDMIKKQLGILKGPSSSGLSESKQTEIQSTISNYKRWLRQGVAFNESEFKRLNIPFQYNDAYANISTDDLLSKMIESMENGDFVQAEEYRDVINQRMQQNRYITENGGPQFIINNERARENGGNFYNYSQGFGFNGQGSFTGTDYQNFMPGFNPQDPNTMTGPDGSNYENGFQNQMPGFNPQNPNSMIGPQGSYNGNFIPNQASGVNQQSSNAQNPNELVNPQGTNSENGLQNQLVENNPQAPNAIEQAQNQNSENSKGGQIFGGDLFGFKREKARRYRRRANSNQMLRNPNRLNRSQNPILGTNLQGSTSGLRGQEPNLANGGRNPMSGANSQAQNTGQGVQNQNTTNPNHTFTDNSQSSNSGASMQSNNSGGIASGIIETAQNILNSRVANGLKNVGKSIVKPVWDTDKKKYNGKKIAEGAAKLAAGVALGTAAAAVQAGISITDGKYSPIEGAASFGAGMAGGNALVNNAKNFGKDVRRNILSKDEVKLIEKRGDEWYNRDDVIAKYNRTYGSKARAMRQRARDNYVRRGITDPKDQELVFKYADHLLAEGKVSSQDEADRLAVATFQYKQNLLDYGNYDVLFDNKKKEQYLNFQEKTSSSSASGQTVRRTHEAFIKNVLDFDKVTGN